LEASVKAVTALYEKVICQVLGLLVSYGKLMAIGCGFDCESFPEPKVEVNMSKKPRYLLQMVKMPTQRAKDNPSIQLKGYLIGSKI
jgi:hypothetical protein